MALPGLSCLPVWRIAGTSACAGRQRAARARAAVRCRSSRYCRGWNAIERAETLKASEKQVPSVLGTMLLEEGQDHLDHAHRADPVAAHGASELLPKMDDRHRGVTFRTPERAAVTQNPSQGCSKCSPRRLSTPLQPFEVSEFFTSSPPPGGLLSVTASCAHCERQKLLTLS